MKNLILALALVVTLGGISSQAHAQTTLPAANAADINYKKSYGDFSPGKKFKFKVEEVIAAKGGLVGSKKIRKIPKGIPKFKKGQKITFKIGKKGQLTGPGFSMKFQGGSIVSNSYATVPKKNAQTPGEPNVAVVYKNSKGKPTGVALSFYKFNIKGFQTTTYTVLYALGEVN